MLAARNQHRAEAVWCHLCLILCVGLCAVPLALTEFPPLHDYANHLARVHIIAHWRENQAFQSHYAIASFLLPNVLSDLVLLALEPVAGIRFAGRVLLVTIAALTITGVYALSRVVSGRYSVWPLLAAALVFHEMFVWGFLNYLLGLALLPWALAAWIAFDRSSRVLQIAVGAALAVLILLSHLVAFGLYAVAVAVLEIHRVWRRPAGALLPRVGRAEIARLAGSAAQFVPALILHAALSPSRDLPLDFRFDYSAWGKLSPFTRLLSAGTAEADMAALVLVAGVIVVALVTRIVTLHAGLTLVAAAFLALVLVLPYSAMESFFVDSRIAIAVALMAVAAIRPPRTSPRATVAVAMLILGLVGWRSHALTDRWRGFDRDYREVVGSFEALPAGAQLIPASSRQFELGDWVSTRRTWPAHEHTAGYAVIDRQVVVPNVFAKAGQNPLVFTPTPELAPLGRNPITRVIGDAELRGLVDEAARARARQPVGERPGVYIIVYHRACWEWPVGLPVRPVVCGRDFSLVEVTDAP